MSAGAVSEALNEQYNHHIEYHRFRRRAQVLLPCLAVCQVIKTQQLGNLKRNKRDRDADKSVHVKVYVTESDEIKRVRKEWKCKEGIAEVHWKNKMHTTSI